MLCRLGEWAGRQRPSHHVLDARARSLDSLALYLCQPEVMMIACHAFLCTVAWTIRVGLGPSLEALGWLVDAFVDLLRV